MALSAGEVAFFSPPPHPPHRPARGEDDGRLGRLIRVVRRELANATSQSPISAIPPLRNYPY